MRRNHYRTILQVVFAIGAVQVSCLAQEPPKGNPLDPAQSREVIQWLAAHALRLEPLEKAGTFPDLEPLQKLLSGVRVVGLGEASHGTHEFFEFKNRMIRFLVERLGYRLITIEASLPACMNIDNYVMYGQGDARAALISQGFVQLDTEEELSIIEWLRRFNSRLPEAQRVRFLGMDMQGGYSYAIESVTAYLKKVASDGVPSAEEAFAPFRSAPGRAAPIDTQNLEEKQQAKSRLDSLAAFLAANRERLVRESTEWEYGIAALQVRVLQQGTEFKIAGSKGKEMTDRFAAIGLRDRFMAENIEAEANLLGPRVHTIVSGHNGHIQTGPWGAGMPALPGAHITAMGEFLRKKYGDSYFAIGTEFDLGSFQALGRTEAGKFALEEFPMSAAPEGSLPWYLHQAASAKKMDAFIVPLRPAPKDQIVERWLSTEMLMSVLTGAFSRSTMREQAMAPVAPGKYFDALAFVDRTTRARPLKDLPE